MTSRHLTTRVSEHLRNGENKGPIMLHADTCTRRSPTIDNFTILKKIQKTDIIHLSIMEALYIREIDPKLNTKDEFRGHLLRIKI